MKNTLIALLFCIVLASCNNEAKKPEMATKDATAATVPATESIVYPFIHKYPIAYQQGDNHNALLVLNCLKKYVDGDIKGCVSAFADTAEFIADQFRFKGSRDSLEAIIGAMRNTSVSVSKNFDTWLTAYYPEDGNTWVTLWYVETMTDKNGKTDSIYYTDDVLVKNGKIVVYDEKQRRFPSPK